MKGSNWGWDIMNSILEVKKLIIKYDKVEAVNDISFTVDKGDFIGIVGPNGSGKTTLIKGLIGLIPVAEGSIKYTKEESQNIVGYLPQRTSVNDRIFPAKVFEIISTGLLINKKEPRRISKSDLYKADEIMKKLDIHNLKNEKMGKLSGGQQQRVLLARAMVSSPQILFLDEPTAALDPKIREEFYKLLSDLSETENTTIILVSHDIGSVGRFTKKMMYLDKELIFYGSYDEFCSSQKMTEYFGSLAQHQFCWRHRNENND